MSKRFLTKPEKIFKESARAARLDNAFGTLVVI